MVCVLLYLFFGLVPFMCVLVLILVLFCLSPFCLAFLPLSFLLFQFLFTMQAPPLLKVHCGSCTTVDLQDPIFNRARKSTTIVWGRKTGMQFVPSQIVNFYMDPYVSCLGPKQMSHCLVFVCSNVFVCVVFFGFTFGSSRNTL